MEQPPLGAHVARGHVDDAWHAPLLHHREGVLVDAAVAVVEGDDAEVAARAGAAGQDFQREVERDQLVRLGQELQVALAQMRHRVHDMEGREGEGE